jgi:CRISPR-associated protein Cas1
MIKRTLYFGNSAYLSCQNSQLTVSYPDKDDRKTVPIEDIGIVLLDHPQITITHHLIASLLSANAALITCSERHLPTGLMLNLDGHSLQSKYFKHQLSAKEPLKKQLWQLTIKAKINNQANVLYAQSKNFQYLRNLIPMVKSGDSSNMEARAAGFYWKSVYMELGIKFSRDPTGTSPNHMLNYGYTILRALVARSLVGSGLLPTLGIFHRNQYNAYCLADDIMEPYRPYIDVLVFDICQKYGNDAELSTTIKKELLAIPVLDVVIENKKSPMMIAMQRTTASLAKSFESGQCELIYPDYE